MTLEPFLVSELFAFLLVFVRLGAGVMFLPGIGEAYVLTQARLIFTLACAVVLTPIVAPVLPPVPESPLALAALLLMEILIGSFLGLISRILISAMHTAGMIISYQSSLASATMFDMTQASQGTGIGNFLSLTAVVLLFAANLHHVMLQGLFDSYSLFPAGLSAPVGDMADYLVRLAADVFLMAMKIAAPLLVIGLVTYVGMGVLSRLMPTMQVFFVIVPPQILVSFLILMMMLSGTMLWYLDFYEEHVGGFSR